MMIEVYICGKTYDDQSPANTVAFVAKLSASGVKEWGENFRTC